MGNAAMDWARSEAKRTGSQDSWLNTPMGGNYLGALARGYKGPQSGTNGAGAWQVVDNSQVNAPNPYQKGIDAIVGGAKQAMQTQATQPQPIQSANFGTYTNDAIGSLQKLGMFNPPATNNNAQNMAQFDRQMGDNRNMLAGLMTRENPFSANNSGYLASQAQIVGQQGRGLMNVLRDQRAKNALNNVTQDSGLAQNAERAMRTQSALQANGALTGLETDRYNRAAGWDDANRNFQAQAIQALNSGDLNRFNALTQANQQNYDNARQQPFDALRYASGVQDFEQTGRMNPLELQYRQGQLTGQGIQNEAGRLGVQYTQQTQPGMIDAANAQNRLGTLGANTNYDQMQWAANDPTMRNNYRTQMLNNSEADKWNSVYGAAGAASKPFTDLQNQVTGLLTNFIPGGALAGLGGGGSAPTVWKTKRN